MEITVVIPTTGERPEFLKEALKMLKRQTKTPSEILVCEHHDRNRNTLVENYRNGYEAAKGDLVIFWEDDDYYQEDYIETMVKAWEPGLDILGTEETTYYHLAINSYREIKHPGRSSAMNTVIRPGIKDLPWDGDQFLDMRLWTQVRRKKLNGKLIPGGKSIGIKHGIGRAGGKGHNLDFPYTKTDTEMKWLQERTNPFTFNFYQNLHRTLSKIL